MVAVVPRRFREAAVSAALTITLAAGAVQLSHASNGRIKPLVEHLSTSTASSVHGEKPEKYRTAPEILEALSGLMDDKNYAEAIRACDRGLGLSSTRSQRAFYHSMKAEIYEAMWEETKDRDTLERIVAECTEAISNSESVQEASKCYSSRANAYKHLGDAGKCRADLKAMFDSGNDYAGILLARGHAEGGDLAKAIRVYSDIIKGDSEMHRDLATFERGMVYISLKRYGDAIADLKCVVDKDPADAYSNYTLGFAYYMSGKAEEAKFHFDKAKGSGIDKIQKCAVPYYDKGIIFGSDKK